MRTAIPLAILGVAAALLVGCGGSDGTTTTRSTPAGPSKQAIRAAWERTPDCRHPHGASRWSCSVGAYRCLGVVTDRGWSVSCAKPGSSIDFTVRPSGP